MDARLVQTAVIKSNYGTVLSEYGDVGFELRYIKIHSVGSVDFIFADEQQDGALTICMLTIPNKCTSAYTLGEAKGNNSDH